MRSARAFVGAFSVLAIVFLVGPRLERLMHFRRHPSPNSIAIRCPRLARTQDLERLLSPLELANRNGRKFRERILIAVSEAVHPLLGAF